MSLLRAIQIAAIEPTSSVSSLLLKLRLLASRLGSAPLEEWIKHESEGYPKGIPVPEYRKIGVKYTGTFAGPFGSGVNNVPIPSMLIKKYAGERWVVHEMRQSISVIYSLFEKDKDARFGVGNTSDLIIILKGKVYPEMTPVSISSTLNTGEINELSHAVRSRILEFTIELERAVPASADVTIAELAGLIPRAAETTTSIFQQTINGNYTAVTNTGAGAQITLSVAAGDAKAVVNELTKAGIPESDATEFSDILASEKPESPEQPFGAKARAWIKDKAGKIVDGSWNVSLAVATNLLTETALRYYGLK